MDRQSREEALKDAATALRGLLAYAAVRAVLFAEQRSAGIRPGAGDELPQLTAQFESMFVLPRV